MNLNDYYSKSLTEANTTSLKGHILESNDTYIIMQPCFCVHHDPPQHKCDCVENSKLIVLKSDIVSNILTIESNEKDKLSTFQVKRDAIIIKEQQTNVKASNLNAFIYPPLGPIIAALCKKYPKLCKKTDPINGTDVPDVMHFIPVLAGIFGGAILGLLAGDLIDIIKEDCTTTTTSSTGPNGEAITTTTKTCK